MIVFWRPAPTVIVIGWLTGGFALLGLASAASRRVPPPAVYGWRKHYGTLEPADVKRLRQLEQENGRLKKMVADRDLEIDVLKDITRKKW